MLVLLTVELILISDMRGAKWRNPVGCCTTVAGISVAGYLDIIYAMLVIFAVWALWEIGATGGADAKIIIALVLLFVAVKQFKKRHREKCLIRYKDMDGNIALLKYQVLHRELSSNEYPRYIGYHN